MIGYPHYPYTRETEEWGIQTFQPFGEWEQSSGFWEDLEYARDMLARRRRNRPDDRTRMVKRTTTVIVEVVDEEQA
jgi:hypothetical protein